MSGIPIPLRYEGNGEFRVMSNYWAFRADKDFVVGETYKMVEHHDRSQASHNHYFASLAAAHGNLPDELREIYPTIEHLRKKALIWKGYRDEVSHVCSSKSEAQRFRAFIKPMNDCSIVTVEECVVRVWTAKSQSMKAMPNGEFQKSKQDVLDFAADLIGARPDQLARAA